MTKRCSVSWQLNRPQAFTLVEVLVVLVLISILSSMVLTAVNGVTNSARIARTRSIIATIDNVIQEQYESFKYRPLPVVLPDLSLLTPGGQVLNLEVLPSEAARVRLIMTRDLQRMELPDRKSDILFGSSTNLPARITAAANRVMMNDAANPTAVIRDDNKANRVISRVEWYTNSLSLPSRFSTYRRRASPSWTEQFESAECLYLIMSTSYVAGAPAIELIPPSNIGDLDGDGMPEILDGWGRPLAFIRWPSGFVFRPVDQVSADDTLTFDPTIPDDFDPLRVDFGSMPGVDPSLRPWSIRPLIISAGSDGEFGVNLQAGDGTFPGFKYNEQTTGAGTLMIWPKADMGDETGGRPDDYVFIDPFLRKYPLTKPGSPILTPLANAVRADNMTNFQLEGN